MDNALVKFLIKTGIKLISLIPFITEERKIELLHKCTFEVVQTKLCSRIAVFDPSTQILLSSFSVDIIVI